MSPVEIRVLYFASLAERTGVKEERVNVEPDFTVEALWNTLVSRHAALVDLPYRPLAACDRAWVDWSARIAPASEVAFVPPVSGG